MCETSDVDDCRALEREQRCEHDCDRAREDLVAIGAPSRIALNRPTLSATRRWVCAGARSGVSAQVPSSSARRPDRRFGSSVPRRVGEQVKGAGALDRLSARPHVELGVEMLHVRLDVFTDT
jgi:hypothetical protein